MRISMILQLKVFLCATMLCLLQPAFAQGTSFVKKYAGDEITLDPGKSIGPGNGSGASTTMTNDTDTLSESAGTLPSPIKIGGKTPPPLKPAVEKQSKKTDAETEEEESILSFNFLYYLIQKYKMEDIVN